MISRRTRGSTCRKLFRAAQVNFAGDGMHVHTAASVAYMGPQGVLALLLDDDRNIGTDFAGNGFSREMEIRRSRNAQLYGAGNCFEFPVAVRAGVSLNGDAAGGRMRLHIICRALNLDVAAGGIRFDSPTGLSDANDARHGIDDYIALGIRNGYAS